ncbi:CCA tRNA nucleotidyltransferase [Paenibacillus sp. KQZ6P-2]|uniref:CCA tRNA nucleotidyltransferase n=1 Tax=Paenibacillus mangrovi TaxID=2931978 RepID=A0A9X1WKM4_9BACL|nr:CCA tRNA nucleotidyltransferase [Paenibacillus mangrovi]MCJ8011052.1 CCA tRNA nucleotidyltransferase [Paenibacillus mangrovi]
MVRWKQADTAMALHSEEVIIKLLEHGFEAYWVGGCVRDELMGRPVHDMDITTSALPEEVVSVFERTVPTGIQHGTVTVLCRSYAYEVTTYRVEGAYENHRRPAEVEFVRDLKEDLRRRDFTINAIAKAVDGMIVDPYHGMEDLEKGIVRCVGNARSRFQEDALRMVRCIRFASVFGFRIAYRTWKGLLEERDNISFVAMERFRVELEKLMEGRRPSRGLRLLHRSGLPANAKIPFIYKPDTDLIPIVDEIPMEQVVIRWALLLYACGLSAEEAHRVLRQWTFANIIREQIADILSVGEEVAALNIHSPYKEQWISIVLKYGREAAERWLSMAGYISSKQSGVCPVELLSNGYTWTEEMRIYRLSELSVSGKDLLKLTGRKGGPWIGEIMNKLLVKVASQTLPNDNETLIDEVKRVISSNE